MRLGQAENEDEEFPGLKNEDHGSPMLFEKRAQHWGEIGQRQPAEFDVFGCSEGVNEQGVDVRFSVLTAHDAFYVQASGFQVRSHESPRTIACVGGIKNDAISRVPPVRYSVPIP